MTNIANSIFWKSAAAGLVVALLLIGIGLVLDKNVSFTTDVNANGGFTKLRAIPGTTREIFFTTSDDAQTIVFWSFDMTATRGGDFPILHSTEVFTSSGP